MAEWWTYSLHDFLLFSPRIYHRLVERYNAEIWPAQLAAPAVALAVVVLARHRSAAAGPAALAVLAVGFTWVAWAFLWQHYATINWAATYVAGAFGIEALLLVAGAARAAARHASSSHTAGAGAGRQRTAARVVGRWLIAAALGYPAVAWLCGRGAAGAQVVGLLPDPTVLASLGVLLVTAVPRRGALLAIPLCWCAFGGASLWAMGAPEAPLLPAAALATVAALGVDAQARRRTRSCPSSSV